MKLYLASFAIEISVIALNIRDSLKIENIGDKKAEEKKSLIRLVVELLQKKDPLLKAILYENMITLISMSVPLIVGCK